LDISVTVHRRLAKMLTSVLLQAEFAGLQVCAHRATIASTPLVPGSAMISMSARSLIPAVLDLLASTRTVLIIAKTLMSVQVETLVRLDTLATTPMAHTIA